MLQRFVFIGVWLVAFGLQSSLADEPSNVAAAKPEWSQWRGPNRDGQVTGASWPDRLDQDSLTQLWRVPFGPSYSGPIVSEELVFTTETVNKQFEAAVALDRRTGEVRWRTEWKGAITVPFFAASNGSWIRATPAYDGESLYVAGMRDVLACLDAKTGQEKWRVDFVEQFQTPLPAFGFASSPLVVDEAVYVQAGAALVKLDKRSGKVLWRSLKDDGGMNGSAFSSPILASIAGVQQLVVQTRESLAGVDPEQGEVLWSQKVPSFRGMNILTPVVVGDAVFTSSYQNKSWLYNVSRQPEKYAVSETWNTNAQGYMSTPVVIAGHAYLHLQNQRLTCLDLKTGERTWTSEPFGKYWSLVAQDDRILALDADGTLLLIEANPAEFKLLGQTKISDAETWAHLAVSGDELFVRELDALAAYRWTPPQSR